MMTKLWISIFLSFLIACSSTRRQNGTDNNTNTNTNDTNTSAGNPVNTGNNSSNTPNDPPIDSRNGVSENSEESGTEENCYCKGEPCDCETPCEEVKDEETTYKYAGDERIRARDSGKNYDLPPANAPVYNVSYTPKVAKNELLEEDESELDENEITQEKPVKKKKIPTPEAVIVDDPEPEVPDEEENQTRLPKNERPAKYVLDVNTAASGTFKIEVFKKVDRKTGFVLSQSETLDSTTPKSLTLSTQGDYKILVINEETGVVHTEIKDISVGKKEKNKPITVPNFCEKALKGKNQKVRKTSDIQVVDLADHANKPTEFPILRDITRSELNMLLTAEDCTPGDETDSEPSQTPIGVTYKINIEPAESGNRVFLNIPDLSTVKGENEFISVLVNTATADSFKVEIQHDVKPENAGKWERIADLTNPLDSYTHYLIGKYTGTIYGMDQLQVGEKDRSIVLQTPTSAVNILDLESGKFKTISPEEYREKISAAKSH